MPIAKWRSRFRNMVWWSNRFKRAAAKRSVSFEVGSNHLELHRLIPFLAEQENSNAFLFIDKLDLARPA